MNSAEILAHQLITTKSPEVIAALAESVVSLTDDDARTGTLNALEHVSDSTSINVICEVWSRTRQADLGHLIEKAGWVASSPERLRLLTALKSQRWGFLKQSDASGVTSLLKACADRDPTIAAQARDALQSLDNPAGQAELYRLILETDTPLVTEIVAQAAYAPQDPQQRALIYLLTGQWNKYDSLDFDRSLIKAAYQVGNEWLQRRIAEVTRQAGRADFIEVIAGGRQRRRLGEMTDSEWDVVFTLLENNHWWAEMWQLAEVAPAVWSIRMLTRLGDAKWLPEQPPLHEGFTELVTLARQCIMDGLKLSQSTRCQTVLTDHTGAINDMVISPAAVTDGTGGGQLLASASDDHTIRLWNLPDGQWLKTLEGHTAEVWSLAMSADGRLLVSSSDDGTVRLWRLPDGKSLNTIPIPSGAVNRLAVSRSTKPDTWILAGNGRDSTVYLWELPSGKPLGTLTGHTDLVVYLAATDAGTCLASGSRDQSIRLWQLPSGKPAKILTGHTNAVNSLAFNHEGNLLTSGSLDKTVRLWQLPSGEPRHTFKGHDDAIIDLDISADGEILASGSRDNTIRLWRLSNHTHLATLDGHTDWVTCVSISPDGQMAASGSFDDTIRLWQSDLARLSHTPLAQTSLDDAAWVDESLAGRSLRRPAERGWLHFLKAALHWRRRHDIELGDTPRHISLGEFDIEIEG